MKDQRALDGLGVLVTRPAHQAEPLCALIEAEGGRAIRFPVLEILDPVDRGPLLAVVDRLHEYDLAIFISPNAVTKALNLILGRRSWPEDVRIAAIGKGSARELQRFGHEPDVRPPQRFDSEALLEMPALQEVAGRRVVIFRGDGGRELLGDTLRARGAQVDYAECYRRGRPQADVTGLLKSWARGELHVVTVTSSESLRNLYDMVGKLGQQWLRRTPLVVVSERMVQLAAELGFKHGPILAHEASDGAVVEALKSWRRSTQHGEPG
jgi:uroporphyrinogen-III synthase